MAASRALQLAQGALLGAQQLTVEELRARVAGRYPEAEALPDRPDLDALLRGADLGFEWDPQGASGRGAYRPRMAVALGLTSSTTVRTRTTHDDAEVNEDVQRFEEKLRYALERGSFLALGVAPKLLESAARRLSHRFPVTRVSLEAALITEMKKAAAQAGASWSVVRDADAAGPSGQHWRNLLLLVARAVPAVEEALMREGRPLLIGHPGLLARYDRLDLLERVRDRVGQPDSPPGAWVLIPSDVQHDLPAIDGRTLPVIASGQYARVPDAWVQEGTR